MSSEEKIYVVPTPGRRVKDPVSLRLIPGEGMRVPKNKYWVERLKAGDVKLGKGEKSSAPAKEEAAPSEKKTKATKASKAKK